MKTIGPYFLIIIFRQSKILIMGYTSYLEDINAKLSEVRAIMTGDLKKGKKSIIDKTPLLESQNAIVNSMAKKGESFEIKHLRKLNQNLKNKLSELSKQLEKKQRILEKLESQIIEIINENKKSIEIIMSNQKNEYKKLEEEKSEAELDYKSAILRIGSIVKQPNFHKKQENISNIILIVKRMSGI